MTGAAVVVRPIGPEHASDVAQFLHDELNARVSPTQWLQLLQPPWGDDGPNHGYQLLSGDVIVGVYAAVYSRRKVGGAIVSMCNLAAFCVIEPHRAHGLRLVRSLLTQKGFVFTDLSPSGNVVAMNERLGFRRLDTAGRVLLNLPVLPHQRLRVTDSPELLASILSNNDATVYRDHHEAAACQHILITDGTGYGYLVFRRDRRKGLALFATPLYCGGDPALIRAGWNAVRALLLRRGLPFTIAEHRLLGFDRGLGARLRHPRPKMIRGDGVDPADLDYLYSELALVSW